jgi:TonB family protein
MAAKFEGGTRTPDPGRGRGAPDDGAESRVAHADTVPPTPLKELLSAGGANLFVLSHDNELIDVVKRAGGEHYPVFTVSEWIELELAIDTHRCGIALLDADLLGDALTDRIAALERHAQRLVVLVAADRAVAQALMSMLSDRKIHRLLIKPPALGITRLLVESAVNRCLQLRELAKAAGDSELPSASRPRKRTSTSLWVTAAAALLIGVVTVVAVSSWWRSDDAGTGTPAQTETVDANVAPEGAESVPVENPVAVEQARLAQLLVRAEQAFSVGQLAAPTGDNALDYYLVILADEPAQPDARAGLTRVIDALFAQAEEALLADKHDAAAAALAHVRRADPLSSRLAFLDAQLQRARAAAAAAATRRAPPPPAVTAPASAAEQPPPASAGTELVAAARLKLESRDIDAAAMLAAEATRLGADPEALASLNADLAAARVARTAQRHAELLALAESRLRSGALALPEQDSALHYLAQLEGDAPELAGLAPAWDRWRVAMTSDIERKLTARDWDGVERALALLQRAPQGERAAAPLHAELDYRRLQQQYLATAAPASELTLVERAPVVYPQDALQREIEGWVDVEFTVDTAGRTRDLTVVGADPRGRFDEAALAAIRGYRFQPFERDGRLFERRVRLRTRFTLR